MVVSERQPWLAAGAVLPTSGFLFLPVNSGASEFTIPSDAVEQLDYEQAFRTELISCEKDCAGRRAATAGTAARPQAPGPGRECLCKIIDKKAKSR
jgi:hypothetical protein